MESPQFVVLNVAHFFYAEKLEEILNDYAKEGYGNPIALDAFLILSKLNTVKKESE